MVKERTPEERKQAEARERYMQAMDRSLTEEQKAEMHRKRAVRVEAAKLHGVAIGWIDEHGELLPGAVRTDGTRPLNAEAS